MNTESSYRILGVDPGLNITGYGVVDFVTAGDPLVVEAGTIRTDSSDLMTKRILRIYDELTDLLEEMSPDAIGVEKLYAHYNHPRTSIIMAHARGVILLAAEKTGLAVRSLPSTRVKKSLTGNGHATKRQMQRAIQSLCGLNAPPEPPDVADALAIALCAGRMK